MRVLKTAFLGLAIAIAASLSPALSDTIEYRERVTVNVGESVVVHGARGECGQAPDKSSISLPALETGTLSLGKAGTRDSNSCGGPTPAIEVIFTATTPGRESFELFGDKITVRVK